MVKDGWKTVPFGDMVQNVNVRVDVPSKAGVERYVGLEHLDPESLRIRRWGTPDEVEATKLRFWPGDIVFGRRRFYQRKVALADFEGICSAHAMVLRAKPEVVLPDFLPFFMQSEMFFERAMSISVGSLSPTINWSALAKQEFSLPPLDEQRRIADILWAAEDAIECYEVTARAMDDLQSAVINNVVHEYSRTHELTALAEIIQPGRPICYGILKPGLHHEGGVPVIKVKDFPDGYVRDEDLLLTAPEIDRMYSRSRLNAGDLLISIRGTMGRLAEVPTHLQDANITQDTARLSIDPKHNRQYVRALLESGFVQQQLRRAITGLAVKGVNIAEIRKLRLPMPPRPVQDQLADISHKLAGSRRVVAAHRTRQSRLKQALLSELLP